MGKNKDNDQMRALEACIEEGLIDEVHWILKSGKEATVYLCERAHGGAAQLVAAKVYRSTEVRRFANDAVYRDGRLRGREHKQEARALKRKNRIGREMAFRSWVNEEYATLTLLHQAGADVPAPIAQRDAITFMEYVGDEDAPAPLLAHCQLEPGEAERMLARLLWNVELMLACDRVHGDLSAFNVLYDGGRLTVIDFPQAVDARFNHAALDLLERDIDRLCSFFSRWGVAADAHRISRDLWGRFLRSDLAIGPAPSLEVAAMR